MTEQTNTELPDLDSRHTVVERIDKRDLKPMYDTRHDHIYKKDPTDEEDGFYAEMCTVKNCNVGRLVAKD